MRVVQKSPNTDWDRVWRNLHASCLSEAVQSAWYLVIHELIPTNERLAAMHLVESDTCRQCGRPETLTHHLMECDNGTAIWDWTRRRVGTMLRTDPRHISKATFSILAPTQTPSTNMDPSSLGLVPNARTAASITNRLPCLLA
jgi:hypothetical protein